MGELRDRTQRWYHVLYVVYKPSSSVELLSQCGSKDMGTKMKLARYLPLFRISRIKMKHLPWDLVCHLR